MKDPKKTAAAPQSKLLGLLPIKGREEIRRVYSADGLSPAIVTNGGGNHEPKIAVPQTICLNPKVNGKQPSLNDRVYSTEGVSPAVTTTEFFMGNIAVPQTETDVLWNYGGGHHAKNVYGTSGTAPTITTGNHGLGTAIAISDERKENENMLRIRKLTESECYRLMGFQSRDTQACKSAGQSKSNIYHQAGDSIVTTVLIGIFGSLIGADYETAISDYAENLHNETLKP